ncbi:hypothetical protein BVRB_4g086960 [Beta vulgaris subsp. vulgaris]|uniref:Uncharacterized protein n=1 Tax=Beta vulgaris subsp. vulgaris TaxID=3555 RepID=A0A0J8CM07_BETVV|nr:hypothetical protein BVRB_4g086960 [Beta vulgaris subsp. vulgaris]
MKIEGSEENWENRERKEAAVETWRGKIVKALIEGHICQSTVPKLLGVLSI